ncbi:MAG: RIP metalloprotease RseP [PS1 clade bacterium]|uniref:Zinc metalloprotease n=1 Tax=PS1 clade bacterium TaxID=2175152 RepID=A0A937HD39_9PROT|nr:RIP metalloprotease RseP [PS1 clade bacterium]
MEAINYLYGALGFAYIVPFLFVLTIVVFFHELGHFYAARRCGVRVEVFSVGFGRAIASWNDKHGTQWKIGWLPLGGYVKFFGDENEASAPDAEKLKEMPENARGDTLFFKPLWQRAIVVAAGPVANFILAIVIFASLYTLLGQRITDPIVGTVVEDSAAARAGMQAGDLITAINDDEITSFSEVRRLVTVNAGVPLDFTVARGDVDVVLTATPDRVLEVDRFGNEYHIGRLGVSVNADENSIRHVRYNPLTALWMGAEESYFIIEQTFIVLGRIIMGRESAESLGGPIRIAQLSGQTATLGFVALINLTAVLSVSIGLINLFPIPMLDGGHLAFYAYEAVFGKPMSARAQDIGMRIGLSMVMMLFLFVTWNDLARLNVFDRVVSLFG